MQKTAINVKTGLFNQIIDVLQEWNFKLIAEYSPDYFDKAVDFDYFKCLKGNQIIELVWDNWQEGEIRASSGLFYQLENELNCKFDYGQDDLFEHYQYKLQATDLMYY